MRAFSVIFGLLTVASLAACSSGTDNSEPPAPLTKIEDPLYLELSWNNDTRASSNSAAYRLRPMLIGDLVYSIDTEGSVVSVNAFDGRRRWRFETGLAAITGPGGNEENFILSSKDGQIASYRVLEDGLELRWQIDINSEVRATPVYDGGQIFVRSVDGKLRSIDAGDGSQQWQVSHRVPALSLTGNSQPLVDQRSVYAGFDDGRLIAFDRSSGEIRWETIISQPSGRTEVERLVDLDGSFVISNGVIFVASFQGRLAAVQAVTGDLLWSRQFSNFQPIAYDDDALYLSAEGSDVWSIDRRTGSAFWKQDILHARKLTAPSILGDKLVVADLDGYLHWLNKEDGSLLGRIRTSEARNYIQPLPWRSSVLTLDKYGLLSLVSQPQ